MSRHILRGIVRNLGGTCDSSVPVLKCTFRKCHTRLVQKSSSYDNNNVLTSPFTDIVISDETLTDYIYKDCGKYLDQPAVTCGSTGRSYTYCTVAALREKCSQALLQKLKMSPGDRIGLILPNVPEFPVLVAGALDAGLIITFANPLYTPDEIGRQFLDCGVTCIAVVDQLLPVALKVKQCLKNYKGTISVGGKDDQSQDVHGLLTLLSTKMDNIKLPKVNCDDLALIPYSSGTTGMPKGVMLTHKNLVCNVKQMHTVLPKSPNNVVLSVPPFFHIYGFNGILNYSLTFGFHNISLPRFTPEEYIQCLVKYRPSTLFVVPSLLAFLGSHPAVTRDHLASVNEVIVGAAPTTESVRDKFFKKAGRDGICLLQGYGMTESSPVTLLTSKEGANEHMGSAGQLVPNTEAKVISMTDGTSLGSHEPGELLLRGPQIMQGYLNNEKATRETLDSEGWLHTGDVCYYDDHHYFYIVDRTKDLIKVKGNQVSPTELENIILELGEVADAAVVGIEDDISGELPKAFVVLKPNSKLSARDIFDSVASKVAKFKRLDGGIVFVESIPRNQSGKTLRNDLKALKTV